MERHCTRCWCWNNFPRGRDTGDGQNLRLRWSRLPRRSAKRRALCWTRGWGFMSGQRSEVSSNNSGRFTITGARRSISLVGSRDKHRRAGWRFPKLRGCSCGRTSLTRRGLAPISRLSGSSMCLRSCRRTTNSLVRAGLSKHEGSVLPISPIKALVVVQHLFQRSNACGVPDRRCKARSSDIFTNLLNWGLGLKA